MATQYAFGKIVTNGLILALNAADKNSYLGSGATWTDLSGNGYTGTLNNSPTFNSANNGYLIFNGTNQNVTIQNASIPTGTQLTFCVWNYGITAKESSVVESRDSGAARTLNIHLPWSNGNIYFDCGGNRLEQAAGSSYLGWNYWCFTKNASTGAMIIYRNGILWASSTGNTGNINTTTSARLCSYADNTTYHSGYIAAVQTYNRALSAIEILQNYNTQKSRFGLI
jgi:hypothetical protein